MISSLQLYFILPPCRPSLPFYIAPFLHSSRSTASLMSFFSLYSFPFLTSSLSAYLPHEPPSSLTTFLHLFLNSFLSSFGLFICLSPRFLFISFRLPSVLSFSICLFILVVSACGLCQSGERCRPCTRVTIRSSIATISG